MGSESVPTTGSALVLGGGGGIGAAVCARVAVRQPTVLTYLSHADRARQLAADLDGPHPVRAVGVDVTGSAGVEAAFTAAEELGPIQTVVDCVGGWDFPRLAQVDDAAIDASLTLNLRSAILILREAARRMADGGRIVLLSSVAVGVAPSRQVTYVAAKAGLEGAARVAAKELAPRGITVNVVRPGSTDTETLRRTTSERAIEAMATSNAFRRLGTPQDVAGAVDLLLAPDAGWVTGQILDASGGLL
jgi:3-oxoacyl-[acyl-carrier protein] reductase